MNKQKVDFPAKLVGYRIDVVHDRIMFFEDVPVLFNDAELERRMATYRSLEKDGVIPYNFELVGLKDLQARMASTVFCCDSQCCSNPWPAAPSCFRRMKTDPGIHSGFRIRPHSEDVVRPVDRHAPVERPPPGRQPRGVCRLAAAHYLLTASFSGSFPPRHPFNLHE